MSTISFEYRAVAFLDVLGFSSLVSKAGSDAASLNKLQSLVDILSSAVPTLDAIVNPNVPEHLIPKHNYLSDSIILSAPMSDATAKNYNGLEVLVMRVIQLTHHLLAAGYLLRGGLSVGKVWHTDSNIIGPAYQEAYSIEANAEDPCVALSDAAVAIWNNEFCGRSRMCLCKNSWNRGKCRRTDYHSKWISRFLYSWQYCSRHNRTTIRAVH